MANTLKMKRSATAAKVPLTTDLALGELAMNTYDGKLYMKKDNGTASIIEIGASSSTPLKVPAYNQAGTMFKMSLVSNSYMLAYNQAGSSLNVSVVA